MLPVQPMDQADFIWAFLELIKEPFSTTGQERPLQLNAEGAPTCSTLSKIQDPHGLCAIHSLYLPLSC